MCAVTITIYIHTHTQENDADTTQYNYQLQGVVSHIGMDATSGHYVTYIHTCAGWTLFDDSNVREVSETEVLRQQAYILFYQKTDDVSSAVQVSLTN